MTSEQPQKPVQNPPNMPTSPIDFANDRTMVNPAPKTPGPLWQKAVASLVVVIIAVSAFAVFLLAHRLIDAQDKFAAEQTAIVNQLITKIDDLQTLSEGQIQTLKESQHKELETFKQLQEAKLKDLQSAQNNLLEDLKQSRDEQIQILKEQVKNLPGAPKSKEE